MRVIAGKYKGRRLDSPSWDGLRPTSDKLRETLFNVLAPRVTGARVLDAYAGTGALGIEALSRGAAAAVFVERDRRAQALVAANLARCGIADGCAIIRADVARAFASLRDEIARGAREPFDLVLLDPPYDQGVDAALTAAGELLAANGLLVLEHARRSPPPERAGRLTRVRELPAGDSALAFFSAATT